MARPLRKLRANILGAAGLLVGLIACTTVVPATPSLEAGPSPLPPQPGCPRAANPGSLCIVVLGDSIAYGTPLEGDGRWPSGLERLLRAALPRRAVSVANWGVPGSRVEVLDAAANDQAAIATFDVAIVIEGVNDVGWTPLEAWRSAYAGAIATLERRGLTVVIGTPPPTLEHGVFTLRYSPTIDALREVAGTTRPLLDIAARWRRDGVAKAAAYYSDLIHQGPTGQELIAEMARDVIVAIESK